VAQLFVHDGAERSRADTVVISLLNQAPVANAGLDRNVLAGSLVVLDGSGSFDPDGNPIAYDWEISPNRRDPRLRSPIPRP
jgi:hypothetical protein